MALADSLTPALCSSLATAPPDPRQNRCIEKQRGFENPGLHGFGQTFLGNYPVTAPDQLLGPFPGPQQKPMENALGITPDGNDLLLESEVCGSCHTIYLPVFNRKGQCVKRTYEQTTFPEWVFSAYRTPGYGTATGSDPQSCQDCHMSGKARGEPIVSKIASIEEVTDFPEMPHILPAAELDLEARSGYARHSLVGLNAFFVEMGQQFPDVLGLRTEDPMLVTRGVDPLILAEQSIVDQAEEGTVTVTIREVTRSAEALEATVELTSLVGHKFPSGVGFRRAFVEFSVVDRLGGVLWASGRTNGAGVIVDPDGRPVRGELWWEADCSRRLADSNVRAEDPAYQPHYQTIERQDQVQIYQEVVRTPLPDDPPGSCPDPPPAIGNPSGRSAVQEPGAFTTSFLGIGGHVKDNRLLPKGWDPSPALARTIGDGHLAEEVLPHGVGDDPDYRTGGGDTLVYRVPAEALAGKSPAAVRVRLFSQATPPFYLQDRFCTAQGTDTRRLFFLAGHLNVAQTPVEDWKLQVGNTACRSLAGQGAVAGCES